MYLIRDTFKCKPGMAKELVKKFKQTIPFMKEQNLRNARVMTDVFPIIGQWFLNWKLRL